MSAAPNGRHDEPLTVLPPLALQHASPKGSRQHEATRTSKLPVVAAPKSRSPPPVTPHSEASQVPRSLSAAAGYFANKRSHASPGRGGAAADARSSQPTATHTFAAARMTLRTIVQARRKAMKQALRPSAVLVRRDLSDIGNQDFEENDDDLADETGEASPLASSSVRSPLNRFSAQESAFFASMPFLNAAYAVVMDDHAQLCDLRDLCHVSKIDEFQLVVAALFLHPTLEVIDVRSTGTMQNVDIGKAEVLLRLLPTNPRIQVLLDGIDSVTVIDGASMEDSDNDGSSPLPQLKADDSTSDPSTPSRPTAGKERSPATTPTPTTSTSLPPVQASASPQSSSPAASRTTTQGLPSDLIAAFNDQNHQNAWKHHLRQKKELRQKKKLFIQQTHETTKKFSEHLVQQEVDLRREYEEEEAKLFKKMMAQEHMATGVAKKRIQHRMIRESDFAARVAMEEEEEVERFRSVVKVYHRAALQLCDSMDHAFRLIIRDAQVVAWEKILLWRKEDWVRCKAAEQQRRGAKKLQREAFYHDEQEVRLSLMAMEANFRTSLKSDFEELKVFIGQVVQHRHERELVEVRRRKADRDRQEKDKLLRRERDKLEEAKKLSEKTREKEKMHSKAMIFLSQIEKEEKMRWEVIKMCHQILLPVAQLRNEVYRLERQVTLLALDVKPKGSIVIEASMPKDGVTLVASSTVPSCVALGHTVLWPLEESISIQLQSAVDLARKKRAQLVQEVLKARQELLLNSLEDVMQCVIQHDLVSLLQDTWEDTCPVAYRYVAEACRIRSTKVIVELVPKAPRESLTEESAESVSNQGQSRPQSKEFGHTEVSSAVNDRPTDVTQNDWYRHVSMTLTLEERGTGVEGWHIDSPNDGLHPPCSETLQAESTPKLPRLEFTREFLLPELHTLDAPREHHVAVVTAINALVRGVRLRAALFPSLPATATNLPDAPTSDDANRTGPDVSFDPFEFDLLVTVESSVGTVDPQRDCNARGLLKSPWPFAVESPVKVSYLLPVIVLPSLLRWKAPSPQGEDAAATSVSAVHDLSMYEPIPAERSMRRGPMPPPKVNISDIDPSTPILGAGSHRVCELHPFHVSTLRLITDWQDDRRREHLKMLHEQQHQQQLQAQQQQHLLHPGASHHKRKGSTMVPHGGDKPAQGSIKKGKSGAGGATKPSVVLVETPRASDGGAATPHSGLPTFPLSTFEVGMPAFEAVRISYPSDCSGYTLEVELNPTSQPLEDPSSHSLFFCLEPNYVSHLSMLRSVLDPATLQTFEKEARAQEGQHQQDAASAMGTSYHFFRVLGCDVAVLANCPIATPNMLHSGELDRRELEAKGAPVAVCQRIRMKILNAEERKLYSKMLSPIEAASVVPVEVLSALLRCVHYRRPATSNHTASSVVVQCTIGPAPNPLHARSVDAALRSSCRWLLVNPGQTIDAEVGATGRLRMSRAWPKIRPFYAIAGTCLLPLATKVVAPDASCAVRLLPSAGLRFIEGPANAEEVQKESIAQQRARFRTEPVGTGRIIVTIEETSFEPHDKVRLDESALTVLGAGRNGTVLFYQETRISCEQVGDKKVIITFDAPVPRSVVEDALQALVFSSHRRESYPDVVMTPMNASMMRPDGSLRSVGSRSTLGMGSTSSTFMMQESTVVTESDAPPLMRMKTVLVEVEFCHEKLTERVEIHMLPSILEMPLPVQRRSTREGRKGLLFEHFSSKPLPEGTLDMLNGGTVTLSLLQGNEKEDSMILRGTNALDGFSMTRRSTKTVKKVIFNADTIPGGGKDDAGGDAAAVGMQGLPGPVALWTPNALPPAVYSAPWSVATSASAAAAADPKSKDTKKKTTPWPKRVKVPWSQLEAALKPSFKTPIGVVPQVDDLQRADADLASKAFSCLSNRFFNHPLQAVKYVHPASLMTSFAVDSNDELMSSVTGGGSATGAGGGAPVVDEQFAAAENRHFNANKPCTNVIMSSTASPGQEGSAAPSPFFRLTDPSTSFSPFQRAVNVVRSFVTSNRIQDACNADTPNDAWQSAVYDITSNENSQLVGTATVTACSVFIHFCSVPNLTELLRSFPADEEEAAKVPFPDRVSCRPYWHMTDALKLLGRASYTCNPSTGVGHIPSKFARFSVRPFDGSASQVISIIDVVRDDCAPVIKAAFPHLSYGLGQMHHAAIGAFPIAPYATTCISDLNRNDTLFDGGTMTIEILGATPATSNGSAAPGTSLMKSASSVAKVVSAAMANRPFEGDSLHFLSKEEQARSRWLHDIWATEQRFLMGQSDRLGNALVPHAVVDTLVSLSQVPQVDTFVDVVTPPSGGDATKTLIRITSSGQAMPKPKKGKNDGGDEDRVSIGTISESYGVSVGSEPAPVTQMSLQLNPTGSLSGALMTTVLNAVGFRTTSHVPGRRTILVKLKRVAGVRRECQFRVVVNVVQPIFSPLATVGALCGALGGTVPALDATAPSLREASPVGRFTLPSTILPLSQYPAVFKVKAERTGVAVRLFQDVVSRHSLKGFLTAAATVAPAVTSPEKGKKAAAAVKAEEIIVPGVSTQLLLTLPRNIDALRRGFLEVRISEPAVVAPPASPETTGKGKAAAQTAPAVPPSTVPGEALCIFSSANCVTAWSANVSMSPDGVTAVADTQGCSLARQEYETVAFHQVGRYLYMTVQAPTAPMNIEALQVDDAATDATKGSGMTYFVGTLSVASAKALRIDFDWSTPVTESRLQALLAALGYRWGPDTPAAQGDSPSGSASASATVPPPISDPTLPIDPAVNNVGLPGGKKVTRIIEVLLSHSGGTGTPHHVEDDVHHPFALYCSVSVGSGK